MPLEVWLRTNTRALWLGTLLPALLASVGLALLVNWPGREASLAARVAGTVLLAIGGSLVVAILVHLRRPRLAYQDGGLLVWLRSGAPIRVPIEVVECFWLGQAPSLLPGKRHERTETASLVVRIAESAAEWRHQDVKPQLGTWCEGYITIRGTWCEPLSIPLVKRLNERLAEVSKDACAAEEFRAWQNCWSVCAAPPRPKLPWRPART